MADVPCSKATDQCWAGVQIVYGSVGYELSPAEAAALGGALAPDMLPPPSEVPHDCRQSVYRCLICLGDLARRALFGAEALRRVC